MDDELQREWLRQFHAAVRRGSFVINPLGRHALLQPPPRRWPPFATGFLLGTVFGAAGGVVGFYWLAGGFG